MVYRYLIFMLLALGLCACSSEEGSDDWAYQVIAARDEPPEKERLPLYRLRSPQSWIRSEPEGSIADTRKPLTEFHIEGPEGRIRITLHNFPAETMEARIPPAAQIARWKKQFTQLDAATAYTAPQAFSGYAGLLFEGQGVLEGKEQAVMGWALQLGSDHFRNLSHPRHPLQMRADVTIKASGPRTMMETYRAVIYKAARSFELIEEIPGQ